MQFPDIAVFGSSLAFYSERITHWLLEGFISSPGIRKPLPVSHIFALIQLPTLRYLAFTTYTITPYLSVTLVFVAPYITQENDYTTFIGTVYFKKGRFYRICYVSLLSPFIPQNVADVRNQVINFGGLSRTRETTGNPFYKANYSVTEPDIFSGNGAALHLLQTNFNCTTKEIFCKDSFWREEFPDNTWGSDPHPYMYLPYGHRINEEGYRYFIIKGLGKHTQFSGNMLSFLQPLELPIWLCFLFTFVAVVTAINFGNSFQSLLIAAYWTVSTSLEQESDGAKISNKRCASIVVGWLIFCIFFRNFYTTTLYSDITADVDLLPLPTSLKDALTDQKYSALYTVLSTKPTHNDMLHMHRFFEAEEFQSSILSYLSKLYFVAGFDDLKAMITAKPFMVGNPCQEYITTEEDKTWIGVNDGKESCENATTEIAETENLLVVSNVMNIEDLALTRNLPIMLSEKSVYENNEEPFLENHSVYAVFSYTYYIEQCVGIFGYLYSSGIPYYLDEILMRTELLRKEIKKYARLMNGKDLKVNYATFARQVVESEYRRIRSGVVQNAKHQRVLQEKDVFEEVNDCRVSLVGLVAVWRLTTLFSCASFLIFTIELVVY